MDKLGVQSENSSRGLSRQQLRYVSFRFSSRLKCKIIELIENQSRYDEEPNISVYSILFQNKRGIFIMIITKYRIFIDAQKETDWLNAMAVKGYELEKTNGFSYRFKQSEETKQYKIVYTKNKEEANSFMSEENNIHCKAFVNGYAYFESKSSNGPLLFNNNLSKQIKLLKSINIGYHTC